MIVKQIHTGKRRREREIYNGPVITGTDSDGLALMVRLDDQKILWVYLDAGADLAELKRAIAQVEAANQPEGGQ